MKKILIGFIQLFLKNRKGSLVNDNKSCLLKPQHCLFSPNDKSFQQNGVIAYFLHETITLFNKKFNYLKKTMMIITRQDDLRRLDYFL